MLIMIKLLDYNGECVPVLSSASGRIQRVQQHGHCSREQLFPLNGTVSYTGGTFSASS